MLNQLFIVAISLPGLFMWRWLMVADTHRIPVPPAPKRMDGDPITRDSDYRGLVY